MKEQQEYRTKAGETVDYIAWKQYGSQTDANVAAIFDANPGLAQQPPELPAGLVIILPAQETTATEPVKAVTLWQ